jgi:transcriptional regulator with XRE-family HTH domain
MKGFGSHVRRRRESLRQTDPAYSIRKLATRVGIEPSYLSKVERGHEAPPSEATIVALARELDEDPDALLAMAGKVASDLKQTIRHRPRLMAQLIREVRSIPEAELLQLVASARQQRHRKEKP